MTNISGTSGIYYIRKVILIASLTFSLKQISGVEVCFFFYKMHIDNRKYMYYNYDTIL